MKYNKYVILGLESKQKGRVPENMKNNIEHIIHTKRKLVKLPRIN